MINSPGVMRMVKTLLAALLLASLTACSVLDTASSVLTPNDPTPVCEIPPVPSLPKSDEQGNVTLEPQDQEALLLYVFGLEDCVAQLK